MTFPATRPWIALVAFTAVLLVPASARGADPYDRAIARAHEEGKRGDWSAAARALSKVVNAYPQDYAIAVALGDAQFRAERYRDAERAYRLALHRAPAAPDARLGLAWALVREGHCDAASHVFRVTVEGQPVDTNADEALAECHSTSGPTDLSAQWNQFFFADNPYKSNGTGFVASASHVVDDAWRFSGAYRFVQFGTPPNPYVSPFSQNEGYLHAGYDGARVGFLVEGAVVSDGSGLYALSTHVGATARWSGYGDVLLHGSFSLYRDLTIMRAAPQWKVGLVGPLSIIPGAAIQGAGGQAFENVSLTLAADFDGVSAWAGGKYGEEMRPTYLDQNVVYDIPERVEWGAWAGVRVRVSRFITAQASYSLDHLRRTDTPAPYESDIHALALGPNVTF